MAQKHEGWIRRMETIAFVVVVVVVLVVLLYRQMAGG
jgi:hypothetical protein